MSVHLSGTSLGEGGDGCGLPPVLPGPDGGDLWMGTGPCVWDATRTGNLLNQGGGREGIYFQGNCTQKAQGSPESQSSSLSPSPHSPQPKSGQDERAGCLLIKLPQGHLPPLGSPPAFIGKLSVIGK